MNDRYLQVFPDADYRVDDEKPHHVSEDLATEEGLTILTEDELAAQTRDNRLVQLGCA